MELSDGHHAVFIMTERDYPRVTPRQDEVTFDKHGDTVHFAGGVGRFGSPGAEPVAPHAGRHIHDVKTH